MPARREALASVRLICSSQFLWLCQSLLILTILDVDDANEEDAAEGTPSKTNNKKKKKKSGSGKGKAIAEAEGGEDEAVKGEEEGSDGADELA
jgi:hypothetical protein